MRLIELSANKPTFRTVRFNRSGLSFVIGQKKGDTSTAKAKTSTYNGVGKSLMFELIHFCLGASANEAFKRHLQTWVFYLTVELDGKDHIISRSADNPSEIHVDRQPMTLANLKEFLSDACFELRPGVKGLTFRSLVSPFVRSGRGAYERFDRTDEGDAANPYWPLIRNAFLFGLDVDLAQNKFALRSRQTGLVKTMKQLESEPLFANLLADETTEIELGSLREEESRLEGSLRSFRVAKDYEAIQHDADATKREVERLRRELVKLADAIAQIERSLATRTDLDPGAVQRLYAEAEAVLPDRIQKRIEDVVAFHRTLQSRRALRLTSERQRVEGERQRDQKQLDGAVAHLDSQLAYLGTHIALDEYAAVSQKLNDLRQKIAKIEASREQRERVNHELKTIELEFVQESIRTDEYLAAARPLIEEADSVFRRFSRVLYGSRPSGLAVLNDDRANLTRYRIEAHIRADAAEGINEAKIFCYDMMILALRRRHSIRCVAHDSSLFSPVDTRQRLAMIHVAAQVATELGIQYIAALNEHDVSSMTPDDPTDLRAFNTLFGGPAVVLRLTDQAASERLLGIEVDMNYLERRPAKA